MEAPIFSVADYGLEADLFDALPKFLEEMNKLTLYKNSKICKKLYYVQRNDGI